MRCKLGARPVVRGVLAKRASKNEGDALLDYVREVLAHAWVGVADPTEALLTVAECTALLAALDRQARSLPPPLLGGDEVWTRQEDALDLEQLARGVQGVRRRCVARELTALAEDAITPERFIHNVVCPLVSRAWLPRLWHGQSSDEGGKADLPRAAFRAGSCSLSALASAEPEGQKRQVAGSRQERVDNTEGFMDGLLQRMEDAAALSTEERGHYWSQAALYLRASVATWRAYRRVGGLPLSVPVLIVIEDESVGIVLDALILPAEAIGGEWLTGVAPPGSGGSLAMQSEAIIDATRHFSRESLERAWRAAGGLLDLPNDNDRGEGLKLEADITIDNTLLAVGDYPGGVEPLRSLEGASAGLALAVWIVAHAAALTPRPGWFVTAQIESNGSVFPLEDRAVLRAKGRAVAALAKLARSGKSGLPGIIPLDITPTVVVASDGDARHIEEGALEVGVELPTRVAHSLSEAVTLMLEDPYTHILSEQSRSGRRAMSALGFV